MIIDIPCFQCLWCIKPRAIDRETHVKVGLAVPRIVCNLRHSSLLALRGLVRNGTFQPCGGVVGCDIASSRPSAISPIASRWPSGRGSRTRCGLVSQVVDSHDTFEPHDTALLVAIDWSGFRLGHNTLRSRINLTYGERGCVNGHFG